jgi:hypothetical protein
MINTPPVTYIAVEASFALYIPRKMQAPPPPKQSSSIKKMEKRASSHGNLLMICMKMSENTTAKRREMPIEKEASLISS